MSELAIATIESIINKLRQLVSIQVQHRWQDIPEAEVNFNSLTIDKNHSVSVNDKGYITFPQGRQIKWLVQKIVIPHSLQDYPLAGLSLRLVLTWWAEDAKIFINGNLVQQGDLFDSSARVLITDSAKPGDEYIIAIRLLSPHHDIGALMRSHCIYERVDNIDPGLVADELTVLLKYLSQFESQYLDVLATEVSQINWDVVSNADKFDRDLLKLRDKLLPLAKNIKQRCFNLLGHAHLDMAWLWTTAETYEVAQRTFKSVLSLQQDFPNLIFGHTSPALYQWLEINCPDLFTAIQDAVKGGKWELLGGMWIEPEVNLVSGESLIRQLVYGQQYFQDKFGDITQVAWLPDSFGFTWQLPQILKQCGIEYFVTGKLHWNDTNKFSLGCFRWESPDGTQLLTLMSPPNVTGVMDTNPLTMVNYAIDWETQTGLPDIFWLPGVGDHGGGPTRDMLEVAAKWDNSPFFPQIKFSKAVDYLTTIAATPKQLPVWQDELYLELHRGCYTTHADQKWFNRYCEGLLYQAELFATLANFVGGDLKVLQPLLPIMNNIMCQEISQDWKQYLEIAWKKVLFNQFHDILPGTSIPEVFEEANRDWETAIDIGEAILQAALKAIAIQIDLPQPPHPEAQPLVVFNSLNWQRSQLVSLPVTDSENYQYIIYDLEGNHVRSQLIEDNKLSFFATNIPSVGYCLFWLSKTATAKDTILTENTEYQLENQHLQVIINSNTGNIDSIYDKINHQEILAEAGNKLQFFTDKGQYWDAWNIDPEYEQHPLPDAKLKSIQWINTGECQQCIRVIKQFNKSEFIQDYILEKHSPILKITTTVDWQETHVLVKTAFPLTIESNFVTYEIPCGAIEHSTKPQTATEKAKWEVSALKWIDLTDKNLDYGVSILNDCKCGYDSQPNLLRITLLRASVWPDPQADRGKHQFTYAIYPHKHNWKVAGTVRRSYELNIPLTTVLLENQTNNNSELNNIDNKHNTRAHRHTPLLPVAMKFLDLSAENLILMAVKPTKEPGIILRCYECHGETANIVLKSDLNWQISRQLNCLEQEKNIESDRSILQPWKITTYGVSNPNQL
ncbi:MAG: alpha-mannosidase [Pleurocapsa sp.]